MTYRYDVNVDFLKRVEALDLIDKIKNFRQLNFQFMSEPEISNAIRDVLLHKGFFCYISNSITYPIKTKFYRVRLLDGSELPNKNLKTLSDFWNPPENKIEKYGRLNRPGESVLYTTPINPHVAIKELKPDKNTHYAIISYIAKRDIKANLIGGHYNYAEIGIEDENAKLINEIYNNFLRDEFSREVGIGTEHLYKISIVLATDYFDLPAEIQDAWAYSSTKDKSMYNVCFRPDKAKNLLELHGAVICKDGDSGNIIAKAVTRGFNTSGIAQFYEIGSPIQKEFFPEIMKVPL